MGLPPPRNKPASQKTANRAHAQLLSPGERANAQLKTWHILRKLRCCPWRAGQLAKAIHVLQTREIEDEKVQCTGRKVRTAGPDPGPFPSRLACSLADD